MKKIKKIIIFLLILSIILLVVVPMIVNALYPPNHPLISSEGSMGLMVYIGTIMGCIATTILSTIAIYQTLKANKINERLLKLEELSKKSYILLNRDKTTLTKCNSDYSCVLEFNNISKIPIIKSQYDEILLRYFTEKEERKIHLAYTHELVDYWMKMEFIIPNYVKSLNEKITLHMKISLTSIYGYITQQSFNIEIWHGKIIEVQTEEI